MIRTRLPGDGAVRGDLNELELNRLAAGTLAFRNHLDSSVSASVPRRRPRSCSMAQLNRVAGKEDVVTHICRRCVVDSESNRNQFGRQHRVLDAVGNLARRVADSHVVDAVGTEGVVQTICVADHELIVAVVVPNFTEPAVDPKVAASDCHLYAGLADGWTNRTDFRSRCAFCELPDGTVCAAA